MDETEFIRIKNKVVFALARYKASNYDPEDVTQDLILTWIARGSKKGQSVDQGVIDVLRKDIGRKGMPSYETRFNLANTHQLNDELKQRKFDTFISSKRTEILKCKKFFSGHDRAYFILRYKWGFNLMEIAECFGLSESFISLRLIEVRKILKEIIKTNDTRPL